MKKYSIFLALLLICISANAQKANFKAAEKFSSKNLSQKVGSMSVRPQWHEDEDVFWYSYKTSAGKNYYFVDAAKRQKQLLFDKNYMAAELHKLLHRPYNELDLPLEELEFEEESTTKFTFKIDSIQFRYNRTNRKVEIIDTIGKEEREPRWAYYSPDSSKIVFAREHNLYMMDADDKDSVEVQLTFDGEKYFSYQYEDDDTSTTKRFRARASWFKDSKKIYIQRSDRRKVGDLFVINVLKNPRPELETYKYAMPGEEHVPQGYLHIIDMESKEKIDVDLAKWKDQTFRVVWTSQEASDKIILTRKNRALKKLDVCMVNANTGEVKVLFSEEIYPYFNDQYSRLAVLNEGADIIWWSERTGWGQFYLYDQDGNLKRQLTEGYYVAGNLTRIDTVRRDLYISAFGKEKGIDPYFSMYYKLNLDKPGMQLLTKEDASHSMSMSRSNNYFVDTYSRVDLEPVSVLRDKEGNTLLELERPDLSQLYATGWKMPQRFVVKAKDGVTDLYGVMYTPFDLDSTRKYPIISYVYPGPQTESVPKTFTTTGRYNVALAQLGFVVVNMGHRGGSPQRNHYYHTYGYDNLRDYALADDKYGIEQLGDRYSFINTGLVGIFGHSGGGFMSTAALLSYPGFYDVAVSSAGNHDNNIYNQWWGETHHGVKEVEAKKKKKEEGEEEEEEEEVKEEKETKLEDADVTFKANIPKNQDLAENLEGYLLLVHGDIDNNVHPGNSIRVVDALIKANKRFDFMIMPGQRHGFGAYSTYFERMMWYYFAEHLLDDYRTNVEMYEYLK